VGLKFKLTDAAFIVDQLAELKKRCDDGLSSHRHIKKGNRPKLIPFCILLIIINEDLQKDI
jgi:hypothetical protein